MFITAIQHLCKADHNSLVAISQLTHRTVHSATNDIMHDKLYSKQKQGFTRPEKAWKALTGVQLGFSAECSVLAATGTIWPAVTV